MFRVCDECTDRPFSCCTFLTFLFMFVPFLICWYAALDNWDNPCPKPLETFQLIMGLIFMCNFAIAVYIMYRIDKGYKKNVEEHKTVYQRAWHLIGYDCWVCLYICILVFGMIWAIIGSTWVSDVEDDDATDIQELSDKRACRKDHEFLVDWSKGSIVLFWVYLIVGIALFIITLCMKSWEEDGETGCEGCLDCVTCYICGFQKASKKRKKEIAEKREAQRRQEQGYVDEERGRSNSSRGKFLGFMGFGGKKSKPKYSQAQNNGGAVAAGAGMGVAAGAGYAAGRQGGNTGHQGGSQGAPQGGYQGSQGGYQGGNAGYQGGNQGNPQGGNPGYQGGNQGNYQGSAQDPQGGSQGGNQNPQGGNQEVLYQGGSNTASAPKEEKKSTKDKLLGKAKGFLNKAKGGSSNKDPKNTANTGNTNNGGSRALDLSSVIILQVS